MSEKLLDELDIDHFRSAFNKYTIEAFRRLPKLDKPRILDIGCGSGVPTMELAKLSDGEIIGIDIDQESLDKLSKKIEEEGLINRVKAIKCSLLDIKFPENSFDIIWAEGSITTLGVEKSLSRWNKLLKPEGFLVVHDEIKHFFEQRHKVDRCGYKFIEHISLPEDAWWEEYYQPLEIRLQELFKKYENDQAALKVLNMHQNEVDIVKASPKSFQSVFCILQKLEKKIENHLFQII
ncbi:MAG: class I SAM-dependent methyltransferase [Candidatus Lokiarchaeota archaeon]|nr:class I SAM-dependent methyltransferase [Candidatus Lokiarchaeota archaeon]